MTKKIVWSDNIRTGNKNIDLQHQELIELINELAEALETTTPQNHIAGILQRLENYVLFHFNTEENLMANNRIDIEHAQRHMLAHQNFSKKIQYYKSNIELVKTEDIVNFLVNWLTEHIQRTDQELARLLMG